MFYERESIGPKSQSPERIICSAGHTNPSSWHKTCPECKQLWQKEEEDLEKIAQLRTKQLLAYAREKGLEDPTTHRLLLEWRKEGEVLVTKKNTSLAGIEFELEEAMLYQDMGLNKEADETLEAVRRAARNDESEGAENLFDKIQALAA